MMYLTNKSRLSAIADIRKKINIVMSIKSAEISYIDARSITNYLNMLIDEIRKEMTEHQNEGV